jgi:hypothetical protein
MDNDPTKRRKLSDHALELVMRDVLHGMREYALEAQTDTAAVMASTDDHSLASESMKYMLRGKKR